MYLDQSKTNNIEISNEGPANCDGELRTRDIPKKLCLQFILIKN